MKTLKSKWLLALALFGACLLSQAQQLSVTSFTKLDDLDARVNEPKTDQNGEKCAIIKVVTTETGFSFDCGQLGVTATVQKTAEVWVYVPRGVRKLKIAHPQLGQLKTESNDGYYWFPTGGVEAATSYRLELAFVKPTPDDPDVGFLIIESEPSGADVYLTVNGKEEWKGKTPFQTSLEYGKYPFRVAKNMYHDDHGIANVDQDKVRLDARLSPAFGSIRIATTPQGAMVSIEGQGKEYTTPCTTDNLPSGKHVLYVTKERYAPVRREVTVKDGETALVEIALEARFATVTVNTLPGATLSVDGNSKGTASRTFELGEGKHTVEASLAHHKKASRVVTVTANQPQTIELMPEPIYGTLVVQTTPFDAEVSIDGKPCGTSPLRLKQILEGEHELCLAKQGFATVTRHVTIADGQTCTVDEALPSAMPVTFRSDPSGASVYVDGSYFGTTPVTKELAFGSHTVKASLDGEEKTQTINVSQNGSSSWNFDVRKKPNTFTVNGVTFEMVAVQGGTFTMGATSEQGSDAYSEEKPAHSVTLSDYMIGKYEVTQELWQAVMGNNPSYFSGSNLPVEQVSWYDCQKFIRKLNQLTGQSFRLPTEAEWEYAARGGNKSRGNKYSGSNDIGDVAWYDGNSSSETHPVGTKSPNELGIYDMSGNVWEWCEDWYGRYSSGSQTNPQGPSTGSYRVNRGGGWFDSARDCRVSYRSLNSPSDSDYSLGFRLALQ